MYFLYSSWQYVPKTCNCQCTKKYKKKKEEEEKTMKKKKKEKEVDNKVGFIDRSWVC